MKGFSILIVCFAFGPIVQILLRVPLWVANHQSHCLWRWKAPCYSLPPGLLVSVFIPKAVFSTIPWCFRQAWPIGLASIYTSAQMRMFAEGHGRNVSYILQTFSQGKPCYKNGEYKAGPQFTAFLAVSDYRFYTCVCCVLELAGLTVVLVLTNLPSCSQYT